MATLQQLEAALKIYVERGDVESARATADAVRLKRQEKILAEVRAQQDEMTKPEEVGFGEAALIGAGRITDRIVKGMQQGYHTLRGDDAALAKLAQKAADDDEQYSKLQESNPISTALGEAVPSMLVPVGGAGTLAATAGRMAAAGALPGALEYGTAAERAKRAAIGAAAGAVTPGVAALAGGAGRAGADTARAVAAPLTGAGRQGIIGQVLDRAAADTPEVIANLRSGRSVVPGSQPTAAQVGGSGGLAALERSVAAASPDAYARRGMEQAAARVEALRKVAGTPRQMSRALKLRAEAAKKSYAHAYEAGIDADMAEALKPQISALLERPSVKAAMENARKIAQEESINIDDFGSVQGLHFLKESLDDQVAGLASSPKMQRRVLQTKNDLMKVLEDIAPEYKQASERYARLSRPINRMQVGKEVLERVTPALSDHGGLAAQKGEALARALRDADELARQATGFKGAKFKEIVGPRNAKVIDAVVKDLARAANAQNIGRGAGSDTFQKLSMNHLINNSNLPRATRTMLNLPVLKKFINFFAKDVDDEMRRELAEVLLSPQRTAALLQVARNQKTPVKHMFPPLAPPSRNLALKSKRLAETVDTLGRTAIRTSQLAPALAAARAMTVPEASEGALQDLYGQPE